VVTLNVPVTPPMVTVADASVENELEEVNWTVTFDRCAPGLWCDYHARL
jgi:hypothetical protein